MFTKAMVNGSSKTWLLFAFERGEKKGGLGDDVIRAVKMESREGRQRKLKLKCLLFIEAGTRDHRSTAHVSPTHKFESPKKTKRIYPFPSFFFWGGGLKG